MTTHDVECLCIGAGILGCGGGGSPYFGELLAKNEISNGREIKVVNPLRYAIACCNIVASSDTLFCFTDWIHLNKDCVLL